MTGWVAFHLVTSQPLLSVLILCNYLFSSSHFSSRCFSLSPVFLAHFLFLLLLLFSTCLMVENLMERLKKHQGKFFYLCVCLHIFQPLQYFAADLIEYSGCTEFLEYLIASIKIQKVSVTSVPPFHDNVSVPELAHLCTSCAPRWPT